MVKNQILDLEIYSEKHISRYIGKIPVKWLDEK